MAAVAGKRTDLAPGSWLPTAELPRGVPFPRPAPRASVSPSVKAGSLRALQVTHLLPGLDRPRSTPPPFAGCEASADPSPPAEPPAGRGSGEGRGPAPGGARGRARRRGGRRRGAASAPAPPPSSPAVLVRGARGGRRQAPGAARGAAAAAAAPWSPSERARARPAPDNMEAAPPRLLLLALCCSLAPAAGRWARAAGTMARRPSARRAEATLQVGGELGRAPRVPAAPRRPGAARGPFVSPARAPPGKAGPRPVSRVGKEGARAAPTPPGAARAGPHLSAARGALRSAAACSRPGEAAPGPCGPRAAGRRRAGTFGPETGLAALRRGLLGEPVSDGRAAGLPAPRTDLSCKESSKIGRRAAWPVALPPFICEAVGFQADGHLPGARRTRLAAGAPAVAPGRCSRQGWPRGAAARGDVVAEHGVVGRRAGALTCAHPLGDRGLGTFLSNFWCVPGGGVEVRRTQET